MDFYIFEDYSNLEKLTFSEHWINFLSNFVSVVTYVSHIFLLDAFIFNTDEEKEIKNQFFNYFWRMLLKFEDKNLEIHKLSWLSITWILKKLSSIQTLVEDIPEITLSHWYLLSKTHKKSHSENWTIIVVNKFVCYSNNRLIPLQILSYWESTVVAPISSLSYIIDFFFLLAFNNTLQILFWNLLIMMTVKISNTKQSVEFLYNWAKSHHIFAPL